MWHTVLTTLQAEFSDIPDLQQFTRIVLRLLLAAALACAPLVAQAAELVTLATRPGVTQSYLLYVKPDSSPKAVALAMEAVILPEAAHLLGQARRALTP